MKAFASSGLARKTRPSSSSHAHASSQIARGVIYAGALFTTLVLLGIVGFILVNGVPHLTPTLFEWSYTSENVSLMPALISTLYMALLALLIAVPIGVSSAIYLVEYAKPGSRFVRAVRVTTETLQGIPSIIYGLFGMLFFTTVLGWGLSLLSGACTLAIMVLPVVMRTAEEALIAALLFTAGTIAQIPDFGGQGIFALFDSCRTLAVHMYVLASEGLHIDETYATAVVLLVLVTLLNVIANVAEKRLRVK